MTDPTNAGAERPLGYWVVLVDRLVDERFASALEEHGVTRGQWHLLSLLRQGPVSATQLAAASSSANATPDDLAELVESEWITSAGDDRSLTSRGRQAADGIADVVTAIASVVEQAFPIAQRASVAAGMRRAAEDLGWQDTPSA